MRPHKAFNDGHVDPSHEVPDALCNLSCISDDTEQWGLTKYGIEAELNSVWCAWTMTTLHCRVNINLSVHLRTGKIDATFTANNFYEMNFLILVTAISYFLSETERDYQIYICGIFEDFSGSL